MKKVQFLLLVVVTTAVFYSCEKEQVSSNKTTVASNEPFYVVDGVLNFKSAEAFFNLNDSLSKLDFSEIRAWEKSIGFTSYRSEYYSVLDKIDTIEATEEYNQLLEANSDILYEKDGFIEPVIEQTSYQRTANRDGLFVIAGILQKATKKELLVFENSCAESLKEMVKVTSKASNSTKIIRSEDELRLKSTYCVDYLDVMSEVNNDKYKCRVIATVALCSLAVSSDMLYWYEVNCKTIARAKDLIGSDYDNYNTIHSHDAIEIVVEAPKTCCCTGGFDFEDETISLGFDETSGTCKTKIWIDGERIGDYVTNTPIPAPEFKRIKGNFWTRGTYPKVAPLNCGYAN